jgi:hypothetical protein
LRRRGSSGPLKTWSATSNTSSISRAICSWNETPFRAASACIQP